MDAVADRAKRIRFSIAVVVPFAVFQAVRLVHSHPGSVTIQIAVTLITCLVMGFIVWRRVRQLPHAPSLSHPFFISIVVLVCILIALELLH